MPFREILSRVISPARSGCYILWASKEEPFRRMGVPTQDPEAKSGDPTNKSSCYLLQHLYEAPEPQISSLLAKPSEHPRNTQGQPNQV